MIYPIWLTLEYASILLKSVWAMASTDPAMIAMAASHARIVWAWTVEMIKSGLKMVNITRIITYAATFVKVEASIALTAEGARE